MKPWAVNLWAGPGAGKSRNAAAVFNLLKWHGCKAELVLEKAKHYTYEDNGHRLADQFSLMAEQEYHQKVLIGQVDFIVTDSPPALGAAYASTKDYHLLREMARHFRDRYQNIDILLLRNDNRPYRMYGRTQTKELAMEKDKHVREVLYSLNAEFMPVMDQENAPRIIYAAVQAISKGELYVR